MAAKAEILLVDDDDDFREALQIILTNHGYSVRGVGNRQEALDALEAGRPDLIILDVMMATDTEGFDLAYEIEKKHGVGDPPIILLTSFLEKVREDGPGKFQRMMGEKWPVKWMFEKPVDTKKLIAKIEGLLKEGRSVP